MSFVGEYKGNNNFNEKFRERSKKSIWMETGSNIIMIQDSNGNPRNLIYEYRRLTTEDINTHAMTYIGQRTR